jgi:sugar (pentulose or hexulose) kinase
MLRVGTFEEVKVSTKAAREAILLVDIVGMVTGLGTFLHVAIRRVGGNGVYPVLGGIGDSAAATCGALSLRVE